MKKIEIRNSTKDHNSYRAKRVKSLFNAESGSEFNLDIDLDIDDEPWQIGIIVGPSGSGKTSAGKLIFGGEGYIYDPYFNWDNEVPIIDAIAPDGDFNTVTGVLAGVGLGDVPSWLRPFKHLSNGQQFRAGMARLLCEAPDNVVLDEFTSVVDRQIAKIGALAFSKAWRRTIDKKIVLLSCHYDVIEWVQPDWVLDLGTGVLKKKAISGRDQDSSWKFGRSTELTGNTLISIII